MKHRHGSVALSVCLLAALGIVGAGCPSSSLSWIRIEECAPRRTPAQVAVRFTRKAIGRRYRVVSRYEIRAQNTTLPAVVDTLVKRAARDGCDALLVERGFGYSSTVWSWLLLFIPITEHGKVVRAVGIRYVGPEVRS